MRAIALGLLVVLALCAAPAATAEPTTVVPEVPPSIPGVVFTNDPSIVDPHPMPVESWSRLGAGDALALHFTTGTPDCYGVNATVELSGGTLPEAAGRACIMIAVSGTVEVPLQSPLGDRQVLDKAR